jgi:hypothetical protein
MQCHTHSSGSTYSWVAVEHPLSVPFSADLHCLQELLAIRLSLQLPLLSDPATALHSLEQVRFVPSNSMLSSLDLCLHCMARCCCANDSSFSNSSTSIQHSFWQRIQRNFPFVLLLRSEVHCVCVRVVQGCCMIRFYWC